VAKSRTLSRLPNAEVNKRWHGVSNILRMRLVGILVTLSIFLKKRIAIANLIFCTECT
jgi:hypothetical protein